MAPFSIKPYCCKWYPQIPWGHRWWIAPASTETRCDINISGVMPKHEQIWRYHDLSYSFNIYHACITVYDVLYVHWDSILIYVCINCIKHPCICSSSEDWKLHQNLQVIRCGRPAATSNTLSRPRRVRCSRGESWPPWRGWAKLSEATCGWWGDQIEQETGRLMLEDL